MAWSIPRTWVVGEMANAALLNAYVRDNTQYLRDQISCKMSRTGTNQNFANATAGLSVTFDTTEFDTLGTMADAVNRRINLQVAGKYMVGGAVQFAGVNVGHREMRIWYHDSVANSNTLIVRGVQEGQGVAGTVNAEKVFDCKAGDYVYMEFFQNSGGALALNSVAGLAPNLYVAREGI
jgi:hypothetical protein